MTTLSGILAAGASAGVHRWASALPADYVRARVVNAGLRFGHVDSAVTSGKAGFLAAIGEALSFPAYYGRNLDALADCLSDVTAPTVVLWEHAEALRAEDPDAYQAVLDVFATRASTVTLLVEVTPSAA